jgi:hypothetical protein
MLDIQFLGATFSTSGTRGMPVEMSVPHARQRHVKGWKKIGYSLFAWIRHAEIAVHEQQMVMENIGS